MTKKVILNERDMKFVFNLDNDISIWHKDGEVLEDGLTVKKQFRFYKTEDKATAPSYTLTATIRLNK